MENDIKNQEPLFNLTNLEFFNLSITEDNILWDRYIEDMLLLRFINFRYAFLYKNKEMIFYFINLLEGNLLVLKSKLALELVIKIKKKLSHDDFSCTNDYIQLVNVCRLIFIYIIQLLNDNKVKLNQTLLQKFLIVDTQLDLSEPANNKEKIVKYDYLKIRINITKKIDYKKILNI